MQKPDHAQYVTSRAAFQLIINREWGLAKNENSLQDTVIADGNVFEVGGQYRRRM
jgi:hypothetical protein